MAELETIKNVELVLTSRCNLKCSYCFEDDKKDLAMSWEVARASVDVLLRSTEARPSVVFFGGEPTLEFDTIRRAIAYAEEHRPRWKRFRWSLVTNGTLLDPANVAFLARNGVNVQLSFDGIPEAQAYRGRETFAQLDALLESVRSDHPRYFARFVSVSMTISARTIPFLGRSVEYFLSKGVRDIRFSPRMNFDPSWATGMIEALDGQFADVYRASVGHFRRFGNVPVRLFRKGSRRSTRRPVRLGMCGVGRGEQLAIDVDGTTHGCAMFARSFQKFPSEFLKSRLHAIEMGDVRAPELASRLAAYPEAVRRVEIFDDKQDNYSSYGRCRDCRFLATCEICPTSIGHIPGNTDPNRVPDFLCAFSLVSLKYRSRFPVERPVAVRSLRRRHAQLVEARAVLDAVARLQARR